MRHTRNKGIVSEVTMRETHIVACLICSVLALQGCIGARVGLVTVHRGQFDGISYEVRGGGMAVETRSDNDDVTVAMGPTVVLEIKRKQVFVYGHDYGFVSDGDALIIDDHGQLFVNEQPRSPVRLTRR
jgi:hypothetical protein